MAGNEGSAKKGGKIHDLKILPEYFQAILDEEKTFEVRKNDRGFKVGDILMLQEYATDKGKGKRAYTGRMIWVRVRYILDGIRFPGVIHKDFVIMSIDICRDIPASL